MTEAEFEDRYWGHRVRVTYPGTPPFEGRVTAALLSHQPAPIIAVIAGEDWRTYELSADLADLCYFEVLA